MVLSFLCTSFSFSAFVWGAEGKLGKVATGLGGTGLEGGAENTSLLIQKKMVSKPNAARRENGNGFIANKRECV